MDKILISNLRLQGILGVNDNERITRREIVINVEIGTDTSRAGISDDLSASVDYSILSKEIRTLVQKAERFTIEALAEDIAGLCLAKSAVQQVVVRVEKPGAISGADSAGVQIERTR
jgi:FolB domain-containing protein